MNAVAEPNKSPRGFGVRQSSGALRRRWWSEGGRRLPQSKALSREPNRLVIFTSPLIALMLLAPGPFWSMAGETNLPATVRVAGIVLKWIRTDKEANYRRAEPMIREAAKNGAKIVCTTECFLDGYAIADKSIPLEEYRALGEPIPDGRYFQRLSALAKELRIHLIAGMTEADGQARYNTSVLLGPDGALVGKYRKQKLQHESVRNTAGKDSPVFETPYGRIGIIICADRTESSIVQRICTAGADFLICPSGGMFGPQKNDPIVQARSRENKIHIIFTHPAEFLVTAPDGSIVANTILGDQLLIQPDEVETAKDSKRVFYFDLPLKRG